MQILSPTFLEAISSENPSLTWCWRIERADGQILRFTSLDQDLEIDGVYKASTGMRPSASQNNLNLDPQNQTIAGILNSEDLNEQDVRRGLYDYARVTIFIVNYNDPPRNLNSILPDHLIVYTGTLYKITRTDKMFSAAVRGLENLFARSIGEVTSKTCRAQFGDLRCRVDRSRYKLVTTITEVITPRRVFSVAASFETEKYNYGTAQLSDGTIAEIAFSNNSEIHLFEPFQSAILVGQSVTLTEGCDKTIKKCLRYNNVLRFQGELHVPTIDDVYNPGTRTSTSSRRRSKS